MDMKRKALEDIRGWASKGAARDAGKRHGVTLPEDSDFPEPVDAVLEEEAPLEAIGDEAAPEVAAPGAETEGLDAETLQALLGMLTDEA